MPDEDRLNLPGVIPGGEVEPLDIIDGEIADDAPQPRALLPAPVRAVASHPAATLGARHATYIAAGIVVAWKRWHARRTRHEQVMRALQAQGDHEAMLAWRQQAELERKGRAERRRDRAETVRALIPVVLWGIPVAAALPGALGICLAFDEHDPLVAVEPYFWVMHAVGTAWTVFSAVWSAATIIVPLAAVAWLHHLGRTAGSMAPAWAIAAKDAEQDRGLVVTADTIVLALQHMPITPLTRAMKDGWKPVFSLPPVREGKGYQASFSLPMGATAEMIADQVPILARNLHREPGEVWPTAGAPGEVSLYVVDRGAMEKAAPEYPLMHEGTADVFTGVPGGVIARGDEVLIPVVGNNGVLGGLMGQGKSNGARVFMLGCALDPLPRLGVFTFANNGDFDAYRPRLEVYRKGLDDDVIEAAVAHLEEMYEDVGRVEGILAELGAKKVTRGLAEKYPELRPRVSLFSECHELFGHPEYGERAGELAVKTVKRARKTARVLWFDTQSSRKAAIPPALVELVSVNACFAVKSWRNNDGFLGDGSFAAGIRATELRPGRDRGRSLITGVSDAQFELLKWYFVEVNDDTGYDAAAEVIARAMGMLAPGTPVGAEVVRPAIEARDLLADLAEVTRADAEPVRLSVLAVRLSDLATPHKGLTGVRLGELLDGEHVRWTNTGNVPRLDPADLRRAMTSREGGG